LAVEQTVRLVNEAGLHARPAAVFVEQAKQFECDIRVAKDSTEANGKSLISLLTLGADVGSEVTIRASGRDEDEALAAMVTLLESGCG